MLKTLAPPLHTRRFDAQVQFETDFDGMERRLREDERRVKQQRRIVCVLRARGADSMLAEELLQTFEDLLAQRRPGDAAEADRSRNGSSAQQLTQVR